MCYLIINSPNLKFTEVRYIEVHFTSGYLLENYLFFNNIHQQKKKYK